MKKLEGKSALVTASSRGIGRAIAKRLAANGALVAVNYADNIAAANETISEIKANGGDAFALQGRVGSADETTKMFSLLDEELSRRGRQHLNILVNNAGVPYFGQVSTSKLEDFEHVFGVNVKGTFLVIKSAIPRLADGGRIISISSGASKRPGRLFGVYAMSKAAVDAMTLALAAELGSRKITVNAVAPGWTVTDANAEARKSEATVRQVESQTALGRLGMPEDIADVVAFLASEDSRWITGQYIEASGGFTLF